jgi:hypothetical protein
MRAGNIVCATLLGLSICCALPAQQGCHSGSLIGAWAFSELGWTVPLENGSSTVASPVTVIGVLTIDYSGNMTGSGTTISGTGIPGTPIPAGEVLDFDFKGTVEITPDCVGFLRYSIQLKGTPAPLPGEFIERFVYLPQKEQVISMSIQSPLSKPLWIGRYARLGRVPESIAWPDVSH